MTEPFDMNATKSTATDQSGLSEAEFLDLQVADADAACHKTWNELKATLRESATLEVWAKRHPWIVAGTAATGGFLLATVLFPPKKEVAARDVPAESNGEARPSPPASPSWLMNTLFNLIKPVFGQLVTSLVAAAMGALGGSMAQTAEAADNDATTADGAPSGGEGPVTT
jgi:hypothetical protein